MRSVVTTCGDNGVIRYAQCWEDADILLEALDVQPQQTCLSIGSAGDNTLALLARGPRRVIAVDFSPAQIACLELRVAAYRELRYGELLELMGSTPSRRRIPLYRRCRPLLSATGRSFWDARESLIDGGIGAAGRFENYLGLFRSWALPLAGRRSKLERLLRSGTIRERQKLYDELNTRVWRWLFRIFFSRMVMARLGRDAHFFRYSTRDISGQLLARTRYALTQLSPADNPYLQWILFGQHAGALPYALRPEHFNSIREHLDCLEWHCASLEAFLESREAANIDRFNLSDVFEYMAPHQYHRLLERLLRSSAHGARFAYWNMLVERSRPLYLRKCLRPLTDLSNHLFKRDKVFFYSAFVVEEAL